MQHTVCSSHTTSEIYVTYSTNFTVIRSISFDSAKHDNESESKLIKVKYIWVATTYYLLCDLYLLYLMEKRFHTLYFGMYTVHNAYKVFYKII